MSLLKVENLSVAFGGVKALDGVSFSVEQGEIFTIVGPNGAGKSTVFNLISRLYEPASGDILFQGLSVLSLSAEAMAAIGVARTFQNIELFDHSTVLENLLVGRHACRMKSVRKSGGVNPWYVDIGQTLKHLLYLPSVKAQEVSDRHAVEEIIDLLDLQAYRHRRISHLPYGIRKHVELGRALASKPLLLLLDEPASGLSVDETQDMVYWIKDIRRALGVTILMIEHDMSLVSQVSDHVLVLDHGQRLSAGTPSEVQKDPRVIEAFLG